MHFLMGLNDTYNQVKSQILLMSPLPPMNRVFSLVLQEEKQRFLTAPSVPNLAFAASGSYKGSTAGSGQGSSSLHLLWSLWSYSSALFQEAWLPSENEQQEQI